MQRKRAWERATARPEPVCRQGGAEVDAPVPASAGGSRPAEAPNMMLVVEGLCLDTHRFPAELGDGSAETEGRDWLDITRLRRGPDGVPRLSEELLVALDWARDPEGLGQAGTSEALTLVIPVRHVPLADYAAYARELALFAALVLRRAGGQVRAFEIGTADWTEIGAGEYATKARMVIAALEGAMDAMDLRGGARPEILVQFPLPPRPPCARDETPAADRAIGKGLEARKAEVLGAARAIDTRFTAEDGAVEISAFEDEGRVVAYVRSRVATPLALDVDFSDLVPSWQMVQARRIGLAGGSARRGGAMRQGNVMRLSAPVTEAEGWALSMVEMDDGLLDVELAPFEAVEVVFHLSATSSEAQQMRLVDGGQSSFDTARDPRRGSAATGREGGGLKGSPQPDEMIGWIGEDVFVFGQDCDETGPVIRDFAPGRDVIDLVLPGLSASDLRLRDHAEGVLIEAGPDARFLLGGLLRAEQIDLSRDIRVL
ncbi:hypothetical protein SAMN06297129_1382 [Pseudooceanicola antarcticus]|uniref:Uncharacterized protein n=1 Tax=Pseudooceanicola antarcticus TaxID=1247613 RepID=A0A285IJV5_9RHOB|nr:hypothetical protein [Pseudooceanicola antarcticus]PJE28780.1 hypothetical protein CVM39_09935 [Pseudooceanicola antarcticus]SNY48265.1 hypothetical protein SAMN06297129_1382 [Pseudooceanicola antarcticus]